MNVMTGSSLLLNSAGYQISRSVRLRSSASAYFNRTPGSVTNRRTMTFSFWMKRGLLTYSANYLSLFTAYPGTSAIDQIAFSPSSDSLRVWFNGSVSADLITTQVFRDPSAWYHIVVAIDTTQATASNRIKVYANGSQITSFSTATYPALNYDTYWNSSSYASAIGANLNGPQGYFDGYLTEVNFIDGQALTPSSFGETNPVTGVWQPKKYAGTYGTNGFYLNFSDNSAATAAAIGKDYSGNGNNWTPNNISVTAGVTYDSMLDVPTQWADGGNGRGNYCTFNPLVGTHSNTYSNGNLQVATSTANAAFSNQRATFGVSSGKWYWEITCQATSSAFYVIGITADTVNPDTQYIGQGNSYSYRSDTGQKATNGTFSTYGATFTTGDIIGVEFDADAGTLVFYKNNVSQGTAFTSISGTYFPAVSDLDNNTGRNSTFVANFGQRPFAYTPPSGFKALNTLNLPTPTILKGNQYFNAVLYSGNSGSQSITGVGFQPDFVWGKSRNITENHGLFDAVRGVNKALYSNLTNAEATDPGVSAFNSDGFSLNGPTINATGYTYVAWNWKEGATQGFDIVTFTNTASSASFNHNLGVTPAMIILKGRGPTAANWSVFHRSLANMTSAYLNLNNTNAVGTLGTAVPAPTSTTFGSSSAAIPASESSVAYLFAEVAGFSRFGSYTGNGSADGPFVFLGFRPRWILTKAASGATGSWWLYDTARSTYNEMTDLLRPDLSNADTTQGFCDATANGFKIRNSGNNTNGATYIFAAFAENPFKNALAR